MKNTRPRLFGVLFGILVSASVLFAQNASSLRGQVVDEHGAVIAGARATIVAADGKKRSTVANANGEFTIPNVLPGSYSLTVEFKGFQSHVDESVELPPGAPLKITLTVAPLKAETQVNADSSGVSVEPDQNMNAIILDEKMIMDLLPDNEDEMLEFLRSLAGPAAGGVSGGH